jgi:hypothetical protein
MLQLSCCSYIHCTRTEHASIICYNNQITSTCLQDGTAVLHHSMGAELSNLLSVCTCMLCSIATLTTSPAIACTAASQTRQGHIGARAGLASSLQPPALSKTYTLLGTGPNSWPCSSSLIPQKCSRQNCSAQHLPEVLQTLEVQHVQMRSAAIAVQMRTVVRLGCAARQHRLHCQL